MQVILSVAPIEILEQIEQRFFRNHLAYLGMHPVANFVTQALLGSITKSPQVSTFSEFPLMQRECNLLPLNSFHHCLWVQSPKVTRTGS